MLLTRDGFHRYWKDSIANLICYTYYSIRIWSIYNLFRSRLYYVIVMPFHCWHQIVGSSTNAFKPNAYIPVLILINNLPDIDQSPFSKCKYASVYFMQVTCDVRHQAADSTFFTKQTTMEWSTLLILAAVFLGMCRPHLLYKSISTRMRRLQEA